MNRFAYLLILSLLGLPAGQASHLSEKEVMAMEKACADAREKKLMPEREALIQQCVRTGEGDAAACEAEYRNFGERTTGAIRTMGKYYDLPECVQSYKARKHYKLNPGR